MIWISFAVGCLVGGMVGGCAMALVSVAGRAPDKKRVVDAYWDGRRQERRATELLLRVDRRRPAVKD